MKEFSLSEALRYVTAGFVFLSCLWSYAPDRAAALIQVLGSVGIVGFSLAFGAVLYPVYRGLAYNWLMPFVQDLFRRKSNSYRTYLHREYGVQKKRDATRLYVNLRDRDLLKEHRAVDTSIANVHLGYVSALILIAFCIASVAARKPELVSEFGLAAALVFAGTFAFERRLQSDECDRLRQKCDTLAVRDMAAKLGIDLRPSAPPREVDARRAQAPP